MIVFYDFEMLEEFDFEEGFFVDDIKIFLSNYFLFENLEINELQNRSEKSENKKTITCGIRYRFILKF